VFGYALYLTQTGSRHLHTKPMRGFGGAGVLEIAEDFDGDTYRAIYTVKFKEAIYVLHAFQKKSKKGIATPKREMEIVQQRFKAAAEHYAALKRNPERQMP